MVIVFMFGFFVYYVLPVMVLCAWIRCYTKVARNIGQSGEKLSFKKSITDTLGQSFGFCTTFAIYAIGIFVMLYDDEKGIELDLLFRTVSFTVFGPPGYYFLGCFLIGWVYSYVSYKRHSK